MTGQSGGRPEAPAAVSGPIGRRLFANFSYLFLAQAVSALAGLVSTAWLARALGTEAYGVLGFGTAVVAYFTLLVAAGTDVYGMREIAQNPDSSRTILQRILGLRVVLLAIALPAYLVAVQVVAVDDRTVVVLWIQGIGLIAAAFSFDFVFQGVQRMGPVGVRQAMAALLSLAGVLFLIRSPADVYIAAAIPVTAIALSAIWLAQRMHRHLVPVGFSFEVSHWKAILAVSLPILVSQGVNAVYNQMDILMLGLMTDPGRTGLYVGMSRLYAMAVMLGGLFGTVFSPALAGAWPENPVMRMRYREFLIACAFVGAPVSAVAMLWPEDIITIVFGAAFLDGQNALILLMAAAFLTYLTYPAAAALIVWHDQTVVVALMAAGGAINIGLNLVLIPIFGIEGAAAATVAAQAFLLGAFFLRVRLRFGFWEISTAMKLALAAACSFAPIATLPIAGIAIPGSFWLAFVVHAGVAGVLYVAIATAFRLVKPAQYLRHFRGPRDEKSA